MADAPSGHRQPADAAARRRLAETPATLHRLREDDDREESDPGDEARVEVRPDQEDRREEPSPPATGTQVRLGDPERPADEREGEHLWPGAEHRLRDACPEGETDREHHRSCAAQTAAQERGEHRAPRDEPHERGHEHEPADRCERGEDHLGEPFMGHQGIAECRVREQLAGGDLVVADDPVTEPDVPPDVRVAERVEPHRAGEDQDCGEQCPARVRQPGG